MLYYGSCDARTCISSRRARGICSMFSASMALWAYRSVLRLSSHDRLHGEIVAMMDVLHTPPSASPSSRVSFESLSSHDNGVTHHTGNPSN